MTRRGYQAIELGLRGAPPLCDRTYSEVARPERSVHHSWAKGHRMITTPALTAIAVSPGHSALRAAYPTTPSATIFSTYVSITIGNSSRRSTASTQTMITAEIRYARAITP